MSITKKKMGRRPERPRESLAPDRKFIGSYIDTIRIIKDGSVSDELFQRLLSSFGPGRGIYRVDVVPDSAVSPPTGYVLNYLKLHRPTRATVHLLDELATEGHRIGQVDIALDVLVRTEDQAMLWQDFLEHRLISNRWGGISVTYEEGTAYYNMQTPEGMRIALYGDEICRLNSDFMACHLEARVIGKSALQKARLDSTQAILNKNYRRFWDGLLDFRRPPSLERLSRTRNNAANSRSSEALGDEENQRIVKELVDRSRNSRGVVVAQNLLANMRSAGGPLGKRPLTRFRKERHDWFLPARENVYWHPEAWLT